MSSTSSEAASFNPAVCRGVSMVNIVTKNTVFQFIHYSVTRSLLARTSNIIET